MRSSDIRKKFIDYFVSKDHLHLPSASLVPSDDPTLLFTTAGMVPFKPYFLGQGIPPKRRITTVQKCFRTTDIERVGITPRHLTFLEMLGNFSFGDYFKREAIGFAYEFLTKELGIPISKLWISVYEEDDEAYDIWNKEIGIPKERIVRLGKEDNFWGPPGPTGPCGPCSEIYYDFGPKSKDEEDCKPGDPCDRFMEIWNLVFMAYYMDEEGKLSPLPQKNIDTGMGLERITTVVEGVSNVFETDLFVPIIEEIRKIVKDSDSVTERLISDHIRGITFLMGDGVVPTNEGRGYVLRRLIRRSLRRAYKHGIVKPFLYKLVPIVVDIMKDAYPDLIEKKDYIQKVLIKEEDQFLRTLEQGLSLLEDYFRKAPSKTVGGEFAFKLYDTYGFPIELTKEIAEEEGFVVDLDGFNKYMEEQREKARASMEAKLEESFISLSDDEVYLMRSLPKSEFVGYEVLESESKVLFFIGGKHGKKISNGEEVYFLMDKTPFYPEGGGQVSDTGKVYNSEVEVMVLEVKRLGEDFIIHRGKVLKGEFEEGQIVRAEVDKEKRYHTMRHHTATHLLHAALREYLGTHVMQSGSLVSPEFLRFDFTHHSPLTYEDLKIIERKVNENILANHKVEKFWTNLEEAKRMGAIALFTEKYQKNVRIIKINNVSMELCGGTHVDCTGEIGSFYIVKEEGIGSGIRRIFAVCGLKAWEFQKRREEILNKISFVLKSSPDEIYVKLEKLIDEMKEKEKKIKDLEERIIEKELEVLANKIENWGEFSFICTYVDMENEAIKKLGDYLKSKNDNLIMVFFKPSDNKLLGTIMVSKKVNLKGITAKKIVEIIGERFNGKGGGKDTLAQISLPKTDIEDIKRALKETLLK
ncbi:MAG: alanine--tRNA ligase [Dictyoglomus turgidum]|jgi:alanyl-tRNA synthetase|nr:MAG: alanine--tRNA ligase [Dictyoglomus turgidum]